MNSRAPLIEFIVIHCQAGHGSLKSMQEFWKSKGWKSPGYNTWIDYDGTLHNLSEYEKITNGVKGFNARCLHMCYRGGVLKDDVRKASDTRTDLQKAAILQEIVNMINWLKANGKDVSKNLMVLGHYQFSDDQNQNGSIEPWERIKECPSFDAFEEYKWLTVTSDNSAAMQKLPKNRF